MTSEDNIHESEPITNFRNSLRQSLMNAKKETADGKEGKEEKVVTGI